MGAGLWLLQHGLERIGLPPSLPRLAGEIGAGVLLYAAYLRLGHPALWAEAMGWLAERLGRGHSR